MVRVTRRFNSARRLLIIELNVDITAFSFLFRTEKAEYSKNVLQQKGHHTNKRI